MEVGVARIEILVPGASSLKEKRRAVKSLKDRIWHRFRASVAEVDHQDLWQRAALGVAVVGTDGVIVKKMLDGVLGLVRGDRSVQLVSHEIETF